MKWGILAWSCLALSFYQTCYALDYQLSIEKVFPSELHGFVVKVKNLTPPAKVGEKLVIPFSKDKFCRAQVQEVKGEFLLASNLNCPNNLLKEGQRVLLLRKHLAKTSSKKQTNKKVTIRKSYGPLYILSTNLDDSTVRAEASNNSFPEVGSLYNATSTMGAICELKVKAIESSIVVLDAANCAFERELQEGQELTPKK